MSKIYSFLSSTRLMAVLFIVYAFALALGTFIENEYNTDTARILIYNAKWFEIIMLVFVINFIGNIKRYNLHKKEKWDTLLLHLAFILILIGAGVTRYVSFEGMMPIREGETANQIYSDRTFVTVMVDGDLNGEMKRLTFSDPHLFSGAFHQNNFISNFASNSYHLKSKFNETPFEIKYKDFLMGAHEVVKEDANGKLQLKLVESTSGERHEHYIEEGTVASIHNTLYSFNQPTEGAINFTIKNGEFFISSPYSGDYMIMATQSKGEVAKDEEQPLHFRSMYNLGGAQFVLDTPIKGKKVLESDLDFKAKNTEDVLVLEVTAGGKSEEVYLKGGKGRMGVPQSVKVGGLEFTLFFGSKIYITPFQIKLNDFIAEKYPGTEKSYKSFESKVTVIDPSETFDARIYMNNVLDYKGYRFFQASFDPDEKGTILSVNHDFWGTWITYIGYTFLYIGLLLILFTKNTRFNDLRKKLNKVREKKASLMTIVLMLLSFNAFSQHNHIPTEKQIDSLIQTVKVPQEHADEFGRLIIQDASGRMKPINTFSSELLRKVSQSDTYKGLDGDQVFLSMRQYPMLWHNVPIIKLKRGNDSLRTTLGLPKDAKFASFMNFFDENGNYKLDQVLDDAQHQAIKNQFQKDFIEIDQRIVLLSQALTGSILKIFPIPHHKNDKWAAFTDLEDSGLIGMDSVYTRNILPMYYSALFKANETKDYKAANELLESLHNYQHKYGSHVMPTDQHTKYEILYNKYDVFKKLFSWYMYASILLFAVCIIRIFKDSKVLRIFTKIFIAFVVICFALHTLGLIMRWYISGHAPWSDAYESMIYVGWATMLFGLIFGKKSELTIASTAFVAGMILMVAHWNWMDPSIGNLEPVLDSYWLMIHVAVIVASYGPFALGMILGIVALLLMIFTTEKNKKRMELNIKELTYINEMALTVGLVLLTIGNFLGGQWANESWGRYWGWDPKETWALVSIMVYAFVIHMRFVPTLRGTWIYNLMSILAFYAILMTYFGVNFYLSGLHSYAKGDQMVTPTFVWVSVAAVFTLALAAYFPYRKHYKK